MTAPAAVSSTRRLLTRGVRAKSSKADEKKIDRKADKILDQ